MSQVYDGSPAAEGIAAGRVRRVDWSLPAIPHRMVPADEVEAEIRHLFQALAPNNG